MSRATGSKRGPREKPLDLTITASTGIAYVPYLRRHIRAAHRRLKPALGELSLALVGDQRMADLHRRYLNFSNPTDVLTFPLEEDSRGRVLAGEVVVCVPEARRRARAEGTEVRKELLLYALHGLLHLCGFDDRTDSGFTTMHRTEDKILTAIGVGPVFSPASPASARPHPSRGPRTTTAPRAPRRPAPRGARRGHGPRGSLSGAN